MFSMASTKHEVVHLQPLGATMAFQYKDALVPLLGRVDPEIATQEYLLAARKPNGTPLYAKWHHSAILHREQTPIGVMIGYERPATHGDPLYENAELHLGILAVAETEEGHGFATRMVRSFTDHAIHEGRFRAISGAIEYIGLTVPDENENASRLYKGFGLTVVGSEIRSGTLMNIMRAPIQDIVASERYQYAATL